MSKTKPETFADLMRQVAEQQDKSLINVVIDVLLALEQNQRRLSSYSQEFRPGDVRTR